MRLPSGETFKAHPSSNSFTAVSPINPFSRRVPVGNDSDRRLCGLVGRASQELAPQWMGSVLPHRIARQPDEPDTVRQDGTANVRRNVAK